VHVVDNSYSGIFASALYSIDTLIQSDKKPLPLKRFP